MTSEDKRQKQLNRIKVLETEMVKIKAEMQRLLSLLPDDDEN